MLKSPRKFLALAATCLLSSVITFTSGCTTTGKEVPNGVQESYRGFVPARIAVLPCRNWPSGARYANLPVTNAPPTIQKQICEKFDSFILAGFQDQPYMNGFTPGSVQRLLEAAGRPDTLKRIDQLWALGKDFCPACRQPQTAYVRAISERQEWRSFLNQLSTDTRSADAILLPQIVFAYEREVDDRGIQVRERAAGINLSLIDTNNGFLLWTHTREISVNKPASQDNPEEHWNEVVERLLIKEFWREFPGRREN